MIRWLRAAGEGSRLRLLALCAQGPLSVCELAQTLGQSEPRVSRHLKILKNDGVVRTRKEGVRVVYSLASDEVVRCWKHISALAKRSSAEPREITVTFLRETRALEQFP